MKNIFLPKDLKEDWLLYFSGIFTWSLITYLSLRQSELNVEFAIKAVAYFSFLLLFLANTTSSSKERVTLTKVSIAMQVMIAYLLIYYDRYQLAPILLVLIATQLPSVFSRKQTLLLVVLINIGYFFIYSSFNDNAIYTVMTFFMLQIFAFSTMEITLREKNAKQELLEINQELMATRFMLKESSQRKERLRISRDLHDVIGHQLTALSLNLEVASHKVPVEFKPLLTQNLQQAKTLLADVREVVKEMRSQEQFDLVNTLKGLVKQLPNCQLEIKTTPEINSLSLKQQLMFCLQEGVSNALRHGKADHLTLMSNTEDNTLTLQLIDNGSGCADIDFGNGLNGMRERLADFNGLVSLVSEPSGCSLTIQAEDTYD